MLVGLVEIGLVGRRRPDFVGVLVAGHDDDASCCGGLCVGGGYGYRWLKGRASVALGVGEKCLRCSRLDVVLLCWTRCHGLLLIAMGHE